MALAAMFGLESGRDTTNVQGYRQQEQEERLWGEIQGRDGIIYPA